MNVLTYLAADLSGALDDDDRVEDVVLKHGEGNLADSSLIEFVVIMEEHEHLVVRAISVSIADLSLGGECVLRIASPIVGISKLLLGLGQLAFRDNVATVLQHLEDSLAHTVHHSDLVEVHVCFFAI